MNLEEIRNHIVSDQAFREYVGDSPDGMTIDLITEAVEVDGENLADFELLDLIAEIIYMHQQYKEEN